MMITAPIERRPITNREEWLTWRKDLLTASDIAAIAGKDPYRSPLRIYNEKRGMVPPQAESEPMKRGRWLEAAAIKGLREEHPDWLITQPEVFLVDAEHRIGATPDALITIPGSKGTINCQIKCTGPFVFERDWADGVPLGYQMQTAMEGLLLGAERNFVCCLVVDSRTAKIALYDLARSPSGEAGILAAAAEFWDRFDNDRPYEPDFARDAEQIAALYPKQEPGKVIDLTGDNRLADILSARALLKDEIGSREKDVKTIDAEIEAKLGDAETALLPGWQINWKLESRAEHVVRAWSKRILRIKELET
jgi:putative phage-type endonuclease